MKKIEEIARALCFGNPDALIPETIFSEVPGGYVGTIDPSRTKPAWHSKLDDARAAVKALREPTRHQLVYTLEHAGPANDNELDTYDLWHCMIDAILAE